MKKRNILITLFALVLLLSVIAVTYAFFTGGANNDNQQTATIEAGTMQLTFADNDTGINAVLGIGQSITKKFTIRNTGSLDAYAQINWYNLVNTYQERSLTYKLEYAETEAGTYKTLVSNANVPRSTTQSTQTLVTDLTIPVGKTYYYNLIITLNNLADIDQTADLTASMSSYFTIVGIKKPVPPSEKTLAALDLTAKSGTPNFGSVATTDETANGLYAMTDDYGTSYYFRGAVTNNYVRFAGYYWRIIRINGDGSIRMIYDGTQAYTNGTKDTARYVTKSTFNSSSNNNAYVGYMYGSTSGSIYAQVHSNTNSSTIKTYLEDTWYKTNIEDAGYSQYISDEIFCNDRSLDTSNSSYTGIGTTETYYGAYQRLVRNTTKTPQLTCPQKNDAFTVNDTTNGNGALKYPVGLITADEIVLAGGKSGTGNSSYYLYKGSSYLSLSPNGFFSGRAYVFGVNISGNFVGINVSDPDGGGVAPVINLSAEYSQQLRGSGTASDPFTVS